MWLRGLSFCDKKVSLLSIEVPALFEEDEELSFPNAFRVLLSLDLETFVFNFLCRGKAECLLSYDELDPDMWCSLFMPGIKKKKIFFGVVEKRKIDRGEKYKDRELGEIDPLFLFFRFMGYGKGKKNMKSKTRY